MHAAFWRCYSPGTLVLASCLELPILASTLTSGAPRILLRLASLCPHRRRQRYSSLFPPPAPLNDQETKGPESQRPLPSTSTSTTVMRPTASQARTTVAANARPSNYQYVPLSVGDNHLLARRPSKSSRLRPGYATEPDHFDVAVPWTV